MPSTFLTKKFAPLTLDATSRGVCNIGNNSGWLPGATVWLVSNTQPSLECVVIEQVSANSVRLHRKDQPGGGGSDLSAYLSSDSASLSLEGQVVREQDPSLSPSANERSALQPLTAPFTGTFEVNMLPGTPLPALDAGYDRRLTMRNTSTSVTVGFFFLPVGGDPTGKTLTDSYQIPPGACEAFPYSAGNDLWMVAGADATLVAFLWDDVGST